MHEHMMVNRQYWSGFPLYFDSEIQGLFKDFQGP